MIPARSSPRWLIVAAACVASPIHAGVWGAQPTLGLSGDYSSNPALLNLPGTAETHGALLVDAPATYVDDALKFSVVPQYRVSDSRGYSSLDSDYGNLSARGEFDTDRSVWSLSAGASRDSSLYRDYLTNGSAGVRRDTGTADLSWDHHWTERLEFSADVNAERVRYGAPVGTGTLTDYRYASVKPQIAWDQSERGKFTFALGAGRYDSLDRRTESRSAYAQLGYTRALSELWTLSALAGYSRARNQTDLLVPTLLFTPGGPIVQQVSRSVESSQNGTVFSTSLTRQTGRFGFTAQASRQLTPSGFAYLSRQDAYELKASYAKSERWTFSGDAHRIKYRNPGTTGGAYALTVTNFDASAAYRWTPQWTVTFSVSRIVEHAGSPAVGIAANNVSLMLSRKFNWTQLP